MNSMAPPADAPPLRAPAIMRIEWLDVIRGVALLGILHINMQDYSAPPTAQPSGAINQVAATLLAFFGEAKFRSMFEFLFGLGFAM